MFNEDTPIAVCRKCKGDIYLEEVYGEDDDGNAICSDCIKDMWRDLSVAEQFEVFGYYATRQIPTIKKVRRVW